MLFFPILTSASLSSCVHRKAHILEIRRLFLGRDSSSRKATTSGVGVACSVLKRRRWRTQWWTTNSSTSEKKRAHEGGAVIKEGVRSERAGTKRTPTPDLFTNERSTEISFILHHLFPLSQSRCYPVPRSPFPSSTSHTHYLSHYLTVIFSTTNKRTERITDPSSYGSHRHGPSRHCEYTRAGIALPAGNRENYLPSTREPNTK